MNLIHEQLAQRSGRRGRSADPAQPRRHRGARARAARLSVGRPAGAARRSAASMSPSGTGACWRAAPGGALAVGGTLRRRAAAPAEGQGRAGDGGARLPRARSPMVAVSSSTAATTRASARLLACWRSLCGSVDTLATRGHGRVLAVRRPADASDPAYAVVGMAPRNAGHDRRHAARLGKLPRHLRRRPHRRRHGAAARQPAAAVRRDARVLDYGCGSGVIGAAALAQQPDSRSISSTTTRWRWRPRARTCRAPASSPGRASPTLRQSRATPPSSPIRHCMGHRRGPRASSSTWSRMRRARLAPGGCLQMVVQRRVPLDRMLADHFASATVVAETGRYRVWRAIARRLDGTSHWCHPGPCCRDPAS